MAIPFPPRLRECLSKNLPLGSELSFHYLQSDPAECDSIFAAAPGQRPEPTTWTSHFLSAAATVSGDTSDDATSLATTKEEKPIEAHLPNSSLTNGSSATPAHAVPNPSAGPQSIHVFALEILVYNTSTLTTVFVSKADSTGLLSEAKLPNGGRSVIKRIAQAFLEYLVESQYTADRHLVLSLFARAQSQYLFPGSVENTGKHVLDDRQLIRWWSAILDGVLAVSGNAASTSSEVGAHQPVRSAPQAYLMIPGLDAYETHTYWPRASVATWQAADPLRRIAPSLNVPPRCLVPRFPDDPKARFALDLDEELPENGPQPANSPVKNPPGEWRSVRSLEQFWELMAYRQECSAGRVVGFLWGVFERENPSEDALKTGPESPTPRGEVVQDDVSTLELTARTRDIGTQEEKVLPRELVEPDKPRPAEAGTTTEDVPFVKAEAIIVSSDIYSQLTDLLAQLDYAGITLAVESTRRFIHHAAQAAHVKPDWGISLSGEMLLSQPAAGQARTTLETATVNTLGAGLIRKRKKPAASPAEIQSEEKKTKTSV